MKQNARAVVVKDGNLLLMKRFKMGQEYYTLLGGGIEAMETPEAAALREVREESGVIIANPRLVFVEESGTFGMQYIYLCDYVSGEPSLPDDSEEAFWSTEGVNTYTPLWLPFDKLDDIPFVSPLLKEVLIRAKTDGFPDKPFQFSSKHAVRLS